MVSDPVGAAGCMVSGIRPFTAKLAAVVLVCLQAIIHIGIPQSQAAHKLIQQHMPPKHTSKQRAIKTVRSKYRPEIASVTAHCSIDTASIGTSVWFLFVILSLPPWMPPSLLPWLFASHSP